MATVKDQEHICLRGFEISFGMVPDNMVPLAGFGSISLSPSVQFSSVHGHS